MDSFENRLFNILSSNQPSKLIKHLDTKIQSIKYDDKHIILTVVDKVKTINCYAVSPYHMMISYSKDELIKIDSKLLKIFSIFLITLFEYILKLSKIDKIQTINNYILSTNFFSKNWEDIDIKSIEQQAISKHPQHSLIIRSINKLQNPNLYKNLVKNGWLPIVSRQVYIFDDWEKSNKRKNFIIDKKLLKSDRYIFKKATSLDDFKEAQRLYELLYLDKYSKHNIQFQANYLEKLVQNRLLHLRLLYDNQSKKFVGVVAMIGQNRVITTPIVGYDTSYLQKEALYRRLIAYATNYAQQKNYTLNISSGAPKFKKLRGAKPHLEYMFVKVSHLGFFRQIIWRILRFISIKFYGRLLTKLEL